MQALHYTYYLWRAQNCNNRPSSGDCDVGHTGISLGVYTYDVHTQEGGPPGGGGCYPILRIFTTQIADKGGKGVNKSKHLADVICVSPLTPRRCAAWATCPKGCQSLRRHYKLVIAFLMITRQRTSRFESRNPCRKSRHLPRSLSHPI